MKTWYFLLFALMGVFSSCNDKQSPKEQIVKINLMVEPTSLDPCYVRNLSSLFLARHLHEGLFRFEEETVEYALAKHVEISSSGLNYTIHLKDAQYSDGSKITAFDFVESLQRVLSPDTPCDYASMAYIIKNGHEFKKGLVGKEDLGIKALSDEIIEYTLDHPYQEFLSLLTHPVFFPVKLEGSKLLYSGPFVVKAKVPSSFIELEPNQFYHDKNSVKLRGIKGLFINNETAFYSFKKHELDFVGSPLGAIPQDCLDDESSNQILSNKQLLGTCFLRVNTLKKGLDQIEFRALLNQAISREMIVQHALSSRHDIAHTLVPKTLNTCPSLTFDGPLFDKVPLKEVGLKYSSSDARMQKVACLIKQCLESKLPITINLSPVESKKLFQDLSTGQFDLIMGSWIADLKDPENFLENFRDKAQVTNGTGWESPEYCRLLDLAKSDPSMRMRYLSEAESLLLKEAPIIPLFQYNMIYAKEKTLEGFSLNSLGILDFKKAFFKGE